MENHGNIELMSDFKLQELDAELLFQEIDDAVMSISPTVSDQVVGPALRQENCSVPKKQYFRTWRLQLMNSYFTWQLAKKTLSILFINILSIAFLIGSETTNHPKGNVFIVEVITTNILVLLTFIMGLPSFGIHRFALYRLVENDVTPLRTKFLYLCELLFFVEVCYLTGVAITLIIITSNSKLGSYYFQDQTALGGVSLSFMLLTLYLASQQLVIFARFRAHMKLQLGYFQDRDLLAHGMAYTRRFKDKLCTFTKLHHLRNIYRKNLGDAAAIGNVIVLEDLLEKAKTTLGPTYMMDMYRTPCLWFWMFANSTNNPLHLASANGHIAVVELLLRAGFPPNEMDKITPISFWILDFYELVSWMFSTQDAYSDSSGYFSTVLISPLHVAVSSSCVEIVELLIRNGANPDILSKTSILGGGHSRPPIFYADSVAVLDCLLRNKANHLIVPGRGNTMTITVFQHFMLQERTTLTQMLEEWGADVALTPLHSAAASGHTRMVSSLLHHGADPNILGEYYDGINRRTPLHWAAITGKTNTIQILLSNKAQVDALDSGGRTPLHWATRHNHLQAVQCLLKAGADPNHIDDKMRNVFSTAAEAEGVSAEVFEALVEAGGSINLTACLNGDTALHIAMKQHNKETAISLLKAGANIWNMNFDGRRALECTPSAELQFIIKKHAKCNDVFISFTPSYVQFAEKIREGIEKNFVTTSMHATCKETPLSPKNSNEEEQASLFHGASVVLCIISEDFEKNESCLEHLAFAKQNGIPGTIIYVFFIQNDCHATRLTLISIAVAVFLNTNTLSEELQVYLYTRQIVPFQNTIVSCDNSNQDAIHFYYDDAKFEEYLLCLLDGLRDEIEIHRLAGNERISNTTIHQQGEFVELRGPSTDTNYVFLSHGDCHFSFASKLYQSLINAGIHVFLDSRSHTSDLKERILAAKDAILQCTTFLVILSAESSKTQLVSDQLAFAEDKGKRIIPIFLNEPIPHMETIPDIDSSEIFVFAEDLSFEQSFNELSAYMDEIALEPRYNVRVASPKKKSTYIV